MVEEQEVVVGSSEGGPMELSVEDKRTVLGVGLVGKIGFVDRLSGLTVLVMAWDGLEFVLGWRQLGVQQILLKCCTSFALDQWFELEKSFGTFVSQVKLINEITPSISVDLVSGIVATGSQGKEYLDILRLISCPAVIEAQRIACTTSLVASRIGEVEVYEDEAFHTRFMMTDKPCIGQAVLRCPVRTLL